ncbi:MAG: cytochrome d ubiquinol oxidase subunit II [Anaerolineaceae bacterium]
MNLNTIWFILIAVLYTGYFVLEGFDLGVGILLPFLGKGQDVRKRVMINTIGPHWDGNEVWLITAGGATFAAFPQWYATLFSGFYLPLLLILVALIFRGVAFEFRSKDENPTWRKFWDGAIFFGSLLPAFLWGVAFANILRGVPIDSTMNFVGNTGDLLNPYALLGGLTGLVAFILHGAIFLTLKTTDELQEDARKAAMRLWFPALILLVAVLVYSIVNKLLPLPVLIPAIGVFVVAGFLIRAKKTGWAFLLTALTILLFTGSVFAGLFPNVMVSSIDPQFNLTITNAASGPNTLRVMTIIAAIFVPIVLAYQAWSYWIFRKRLTTEPQHLEY